MNDRDARRSTLIGPSVATLAAAEERRQRYVRVLRAAVVVLAVLSAGTFGYDYLTDHDYSWVTSLYMTVVTVSTVGFGEVIPIDTDALRVFTMSLILFGGGSIVYFLTAITAVVIEGDLVHNFWMRRQRARLQATRRHVILAGLGRTGRYALAELRAARIPVVLIDAEPSRIDESFDRLGRVPPFVTGDALDEGVLRAAGIERAAGLIAALGDDRENLYLAVTARQLNPTLRLVTTAERPANISRFQQVGVDAVVSTARMGGRRLANSLLQPALLAFLDAMLASESRGLQLLPFVVEPESALVGHRLRELSLPDRTGCLVAGLREPGDESYCYHPGPDRVVEVGTSLLVLGDRKELRRLRRLSKGGRR